MKGFTLLEVLIATGIMAILAISLFAVMEVGRGSWYTGDVSAELRQEIIKAFMTMERELKETRAASAQLSLNYENSANVLSFRVPEDSADLDDTVLDVVGHVEWSDNITYALNGSGQIIRTHLGVTTILANNITNLLFSRVSPPPPDPELPLNILEIYITAGRMSPLGRQIQETGQINIKMRN
jgi:prepilin-type N-terminal cleavage/methylation domain-containing protein